MTSRRLDIALAQGGHARSRTHARRIIEEGRARIDGTPATKASTTVAPGAHLEVTDVPDGLEYASRAAHKLIGALEALDLDVAGLRCLDAGASTGGFTDVLLRRGAREVVAVDIGHEQLVDHLRTDPRVQVHEGTSVRGLRPDTVGGTVRLLVADLSFISLRTVVPDLATLLAPGGDMVLMVKPQFEVGREHLPRTGVVGSDAERVRAVRAVVEAAAREQLHPVAVAASPLPGQDGNHEYFLHLRPAGRTSVLRDDAYDMIDQAVLDAGHLRRVDRPSTRTTR